MATVHKATWLHRLPPTPEGVRGVAIFEYPYLSDADLAALATL